jgi:hypothetical protein
MNNLCELLRIMLISIPEEFFISFLILYFIKIWRINNHDFFDISNNFKQQIIKLLLISVIPMAILSNVLVTLKVDMNLSLLIGILTTAITIILFLKIKNISKIILVNLVCFMSFAIFIMLEGAMYHLAYILTNTSFETTNGSLLMSLLITSFPRIIEYCFIFFVFFKKNIIIKTDVYKTIIKSKSLLIISTLYITANVSAFIIFSKCVLLGQIMGDENNIYKILITLGIFILISFDIFSMWLVTTLIQIKERYKYKYGKGG